MLESILSVGRTIAHSSEQFDDFGMQIVHSHFHRSRFAVLTHLILDFFPCLIDHFLDSGRMDSSVYDQLLQCDPGDFTPYRIETGQDDCFRRIVDDQIDTGQRFQRTDVASFTADDSAFHFIGRKLHNGNRGLGNMVDCTSLDGIDDNFLSLLVRIRLGLLVQLLVDSGDICFCVILHFRKELILCFLRSHSGNLLQRSYAFFVLILNFFFLLA